MVHFDAYNEYIPIYRIITKKQNRGTSRGSQKELYLFLCRFFLSFFLRLWVAIFLSLRFLPQGTSTSPFCSSAGNLIQYEPDAKKDQGGKR
jgi:hypothetical protein